MWPEETNQVMGSGEYPAREKQVSALEQVDLCNRSLSELSEMVNMLEGKLQPILGYPNPKSVEGALRDEMKTPEIKIVDQLFKMNGRIMKMLDQVRDLNGRVQL